MRGVSFSRSVCKSVSQERLGRVDEHVVDFPNQTPIFKVLPCPVATGEPCGTWTAASETTEVAETDTCTRRRNSARERKRERKRWTERKMEYRNIESAKLVQQSREVKEKKNI